MPTYPCVLRFVCVIHEHAVGTGLTLATSQCLCPHTAPLQVASKDLPSSGLLNLSGLRLLWVSRKGQLLFEAAPEEPPNKAFSWSQLSRKIARFFSSKEKLQGYTSSSLPNSTAVPRGSTPRGDSSHNKDHMAVVIGSGGAITPADVILQVCKRSGGGG